MKKAALVMALSLIACDDSAPKSTGGSDQNPGLTLQDVRVPPDIPIIDSSPPRDAAPDAAPVSSCDDVTILDPHEAYCTCHPQCCQRQEWYCPPRPDQQIHARSIIISICDEEHLPCDQEEDASCPPPSILHEGECTLVHECPPGSTGEFIQWFDCELPDGTQGRQKIWCNKGALIPGPCQPCVDEECNGLDDDCDNRIDEGDFPCQNDCGEGEAICVMGELVDCDAPSPEEEVCDFEDNDCDGNTDEGQRNACDRCGPVPAEQCDGDDNDCDGVTDEELVRECETPCERGTETCIAGRWASCTARRPEAEVCDGLDNDCNGLPDDGLECLCTIDQVGVLFPCSEPPLMCGMGFKTCQCVDVDCQEIIMTPCLSLCSYLPLDEGEQCHPGIGRPIEQEVCNNFDEDCDDLVDEQLRQPCYTGPPDSLNIGICEAGEQLCFEGRWGAPNPGGMFTPGICGDEVVPTEEICNGADDDCDGIIDRGQEVADTDVLLVIDTSGSMSDEIRAVFIALGRFAQHFDAEDAIHWGLIIGPVDGPHPDNPRSHAETLMMISDISPFQDFLQRFSTIDFEDIDGGNEMLRDAVFLSVRNLGVGVEIGQRRWVGGIFSEPPLEDFVVNWRRNTDRIVIVFTDEASQSYLEPEVTGGNLNDALAAARNTTLYTFASPFYDWDERAVATGGQNFNLTNDPVSMYNDLMSIIDQACLPRANMNNMGAQEQGANNLTIPNWRFYKNVSREHRTESSYSLMCLPWHRQ